MKVLINDDPTPVDWYTWVYENAEWFALAQLNLIAAQLRRQRGKVKMKPIEGRAITVTYVSED